MGGSLTRGLLQIYANELVPLSLGIDGPVFRHLRLERTRPHSILLPFLLVHPIDRNPRYTGSRLGLQQLVGLHARRSSGPAS